MKTINTATLLTVHRKFSTAILILCLIWISSGFMHPIMGWTNPKAKQFRPPVAKLNSTSINIKELIKKQKLINISKVRLISWDQKDFFQIKSSGLLRYFTAESGEEVKDGDIKYAKFLARYYGLEKDSITNVKTIRNFNYKYPFINRLLPVQKVSFMESGHDYYIHTESSQLGTVGTTHKDIMSLFFKLFHNLSFLDAAPWLKLIVVSLAMGLIAFVTCTGIYLYFKLKLKRKGLRQWHVRSGLISSLFILFLTFSGMFHIAVKTIRVSNRPPFIAAYKNPETWNLRLKDLTKNVLEASISTMKNRDYLRVKKFDQKTKRPQISYFPMDGTSNNLTDKAFAKGLASQMTDKPESEIESLVLIIRFSGEYGFVNKRLPVWKVSFKNSSKTLYIETSSQKKALEVNSLKRLEGFSFAYLHKAHYLDFLGRNGRNITLMFLCILIGFSAFSGVKMKTKIKH